MRTPVLALATAAFAMAALNGCAETTTRVAERIEYGVVENIETYRAANDTPPVGAVLGGIAGGVLGHQVGGGRGKDVATVAGALGGAYAGNKIQRANEHGHSRVTVRLDGGARVEADEAGESDLRVGDRVRVVNGIVHRE